VPASRKGFSVGPFLVNQLLKYMRQDGRQCVRGENMVAKAPRDRSSFSAAKPAHCNGSRQDLLISAPSQDTGGFFRALIGVRCDPAGNLLVELGGTDLQE